MFSTKNVSSKKKLYLRILFASILASFGGFIAYDYFATPSLHGIMSGDILLFFLVLLLPRKSKFKIILLLGCVAAVIFFNPVVGIIGLCAICVSIIKRDSFKKSLLFPAPLVLLSVVSECASFFKKSFMMDIAQIWEVSSFFWWGTILFFLIPLGYTVAIIWFSKDILQNKVALKPIYAIAAILIVLFINTGFTHFQNRMLLIDFPIYRQYWDYNINKPFGTIEFSNGIEGELLNENTRKIFNIWEPLDKEESPPVESENSLFPKNVSIKKKAVYILVESYGVHKDTTIAKHMILAPFKNAKVSFSGILSRGTMYTQGAELEDLGNIYYRDSTIIPLISSMKKENIESYFIHGYTGTFYSRMEKYRNFGFDSLLFIDEIKTRNHKICRYGFEGICDSSMTGVIDSILNRPGDKFVFWTTLDSHPPYNGNLNLPSYSVFCKNYTISDKMCIYLSLIENTLKDIVKLAQKHPDYQFVIRGDHRPMATIDPEDFYYAWVPMIILN